MWNRTESREGDGTLNDITFFSPFFRLIRLGGIFFLLKAFCNLLIGGLMMHCCVFGRVFCSTLTANRCSWKLMNAALSSNELEDGTGATKAFHLLWRDLLVFLLHIAQRTAIKFFCDECGFVVPQLCNDSIMGGKMAILHGCMFGRGLGNWGESMVRTKRRKSAGKTETNVHY